MTDLLTDKPAHSITRSFRLPLDTLTLLDMLQDRFSQELGFKISHSRLLTIALYQLKDKTIKQLLNK